MEADSMKEGEERKEDAKAGADEKHSVEEGEVE